MMLSVRHNKIQIHMMLSVRHDKVQIHMMLPVRHDKASMLLQLGRQLPNLLPPVLLMADVVDG